MAPHSSTLTWKSPWMEEPGRLQSMGSLRVRHKWATSLSLFLSCTGKGNGNPSQCSCLENPRDGGAWWAAVYGIAQSQTQLKRLSSSSKNTMKKLLSSKGRKVMTNLDSILKSRDITLSTKVCLVKAMVFPVVMYGCESWTIKKAECRIIDAFELWCWRRLLRVPWTARRSNQSILEEISSGCSLEGLMLKLKLQYFGHPMQRRAADSVEKTLMLGKTEGRRRREQQRMRWLGGIMDSVDVSSSKLREIVKDRQAWCAAVHGVSAKVVTEWLNKMMSIVVSVSGVQQSDSVIPTCVSILFQILFLFRLFRILSRVLCAIQ